MKKISGFFIALVVFAVCYSPAAHAQGGVAINPAGSVPDNSAALDINFNNKGLLVPRMSTVQRDAIASPASGLTIFNTDCSVYNYNAGTPSVPVWATINATNVINAAVSISANPVGAICQGNNVTFTATPSSGINSPAYQWQVNGANAGTNSPVFADSLLTNGDVVTCMLSTNEACVIGSPATSNAINMTVNPVPATPGSISGSTSVCPGSSGNVYSISPVAGASSYNWIVPGDAAITAGAGNTSITVTFGSDSGNISVTALNSCGISGASTLPVTINYSSGTQTYTYTGNEQTFTVPTCVTAVTIAAYGAQGGSQYGNNGAYGGHASGTLAVTPGQLLYIFVGGQNGYNGGGTGTNASNGGGMSDVRTGGNGIGNWVIVAGGGGGGGNNGSGSVNSATGTGGGGPLCSNGAAGGGGGYYVGGSGSQGGAGTCGAGGAAGNSGGGWGGGAGGGGLTGGGDGGNTGGYGNQGSPGTMGQGGNWGTNGSCGSYSSAGGGGGGYYGGGGGAICDCAGGSGGGGSSWALPTMTNLSFSGGVQAGDGKVVISW